MQIFNLNPMTMFSWERDKNWRSYSNITPHSSKFSHLETHATPGSAGGTGLWRVQIYQPVPVPAGNPHANPCGFENPCRSLCTTMAHYHKCSITWRSLIRSSSSHKVLICLLFANTEVNCFVPLPLCCIYWCFIRSLIRSSKVLSPLPFANTELFLLVIILQ